MEQCDHKPPEGGYKDELSSRTSAADNAWLARRLSLTIADPWVGQPANILTTLAEVKHIMDCI